jgi:TatD DNase family protein
MPQLFKYIDTHCHLNFKEFKDDADEVIAHSLAADTALILVSSEIKTSERAVTYADKYEAGVYAAIGLHPIHLENILAENHNVDGDYKFETRAEEFNYQAYFDLAKGNKKVVAIGEIGLDYFHIDKSSDVAITKDKQIKVFKEQLKLAHNLDLPVIIHCREAHEDLLPLLTEFKAEYQKGENWGVIHCFSGDLVLAEKYRELGLMISFTGLITFAKNWDEVIRNFPIENMMIETDSPYMAPIPFRGTRNEPKNVREVARRMGMLKSLSMEDVGALTYKNAQMIFKI